MSNTRKFARLLALGLPLQLVMAWGPMASAWAGPTADVPAARQEVETLRSQLERVNAEIKALKAAPRSLSVDYRLRQDLADAEALGRRLTEAEGKLRGARKGPDLASPVGPTPSAEATDGPAELAAKADILLDQAQKLSAQADRIESRVERERVRGTLRARTRHLEQDPFVTLEGAKRSIVLSRTETKTAVFTDNSAKGNQENGPSNDSVAPPPTPVVAGAPTGSPGNPRAPQAPEPTTVTTTSVSLSFRALLDARALAEVERIEASGDPQARAKALAAAVSSLRKQARELEAKAAALRNTK